jgi:hypothetical protein
VWHLAREAVFPSSSSRARRQPGCGLSAPHWGVTPNTIPSMRVGTPSIRVATLGALFGLALASHAAEPDYRLKRDEPEMGSHIRKTYAWSRLIPLDLPYHRFTLEQKLALKSMYEPMPEDDEPPFPQDGLRPIIQSLSRLIGGLGIEGQVRVHVTVSADGHATEFRFYKMPDERTGRAVAHVFTQTTFKPARCAGQPCQMDFPFTTELRRE